MLLGPSSFNQNDALELWQIRDQLEVFSQTVQVKLTHLMKEISKLSATYNDEKYYGLTHVMGPMGCAGSMGCAFTVNTTNHKLIMKTDFQKELSNQLTTLENQINTMITEVQCLPGGSAYTQAKEHFEETVDK
jgi:hypothetical protein